MARPFWKGIGDLARHLERVAEHMLPHAADRPLMLMRCQDGVGAPCFYPKHPSPGMWNATHRVAIAESSGPATDLVVRDAAGLVALVQSGAIEIAPCSARARAVAAPWSALTPRLDPTKYTLSSLLTGRLAPDPWAGMDGHRARLPAALLRSVPA